MDSDLDSDLDSNLDSDLDSDLDSKLDSRKCVVFFLCASTNPNQLVDGGSAKSVMSVYEI